jgi:hypothetical protein
MLSHSHRSSIFPYPHHFYLYPFKCSTEHSLSHTYVSFLYPTLKGLLLGFLFSSNAEETEKEMLKLEALVDNDSLSIIFSNQEMLYFLSYLY